MPAPEGNTNNLKWKTPEERREAFDHIYNHLAEGYSKESLTICDWDTVERYCQNFPVEFPTEKLREAMRHQRFTWEEIGLKGAQGKVEGFNATSWIFNMKNRFPNEWREKQEIEQKTFNVTISGDDAEL